MHSNPNAVVCQDIHCIGNLHRADTVKMKQHPCQVDIGTGLERPLNRCEIVLRFLRMYACLQKFVS